VLGHAILASMLWNHAKSVDLKSKASTISCYMFIWKRIVACIDFLEKCCKIIKRNVGQSGPHGELV
ncbi:hypothetical protein H0E87_012438, partial [Populus deltoides]